MCGIAGYYNKLGAPVASSEAVLNMLQIQKHRGPDDSGIRAFSLISQITLEYPNNEPVNIDHSYEGVVGFNRLSILDLSVNGHQPMCSPDGNVMLAFNGEIYNAFDFRPELELTGYRFKSTSDTEVILALYLQYGFERMITQLNGMFALVLIDTARQAMYIARDRFGIKPMYLFETHERVAFASEIKSFMALPEFSAQLNHSLLDEFLIFRNTLNKTLFNSVEGLDPGTYRIYTPSSVETRKFFTIDSFNRRESSPSWEESISSLKHNLSTSVKRQLLSDVKLGCQLSGGVDSSLVTYFAKKYKQDDLLETISIVFANQLFNEEKYVDHATQTLGVKAHKFQLDPQYYLQHFENATWHFEAPLNHPNTIGIYYLSQNARQFVTVLLSGEGADEVYGGYNRFASVVHPFHWQTYLSNLKKNKANPMQHIWSYLSTDYRAIMGSAYMTSALASSIKPNFNLEMALHNRRDLYNHIQGSIFDRQVKYEMLSYLPDLLLRQDKMSMAHSIENRVPFLDNELVEQSFQIPLNHLIGKTNQGEQSKLVLKKITNEIFGEDFSYRTKGGFGIPLRDFFSNRNFQIYLMDELVPSLQSRKIFNTTQLIRWVHEIKTIHPQELDALWIMLAFEVWLKGFNVRV